MKLQLERPLVFLDLEATGINVAHDRIVEICLYKVQPDNAEMSFTQRFNPGIPIPLEVSEIHGIYDIDVLNEPMFQEKAEEINSFLEGCDLAGFNSNRFDVPMLVEEFLRSDVPFSIQDRNLIDVQNIFHKKEERTLSAALKFYCNKDLENAHSAEADALATYEVFKAQLEKYDDLPADSKGLHEFSRHHKHVDLMGRITEGKSGSPVFNFGKYKGQEVTKVLEKDPAYYGWMMNGDFPQYTKQVLTEIKESMS